MKYELASRIGLPIDRATVFEFFSSAVNLGQLTPPELHFRIRSPQPIVMEEGTLIDYTIQLWGVPLKSWIFAPIRRIRHFPTDRRKTAP